MSQRIDRTTTSAIIGGGMLLFGAALVDLGRLTGQPLVQSSGNLLSALAGLPLIGLPLGLHRAEVVPRSPLGRLGTVCWAVGTAIVSLVDLPTVVNPQNTSAGAAFGPAGLILLSLGFLAWLGASRRSVAVTGRQRWLLLVAGLWFVLTFPAIQLPLFVIPYGQPLFLLLSGVYGLLQLLLGASLRQSAVRTVLAATQ